MNEGPFPHSHHCVLCLRDGGPPNVVKRCVLMVSIFMFSVIGDTEQRFTCLLAVYAASSENCLFSLSAHLTHGLFGPFWLLETMHVASVKLSGVLHTESEKKRSKNKKN